MTPDNRPAGPPAESGFRKHWLSSTLFIAGVACILIAAVLSDSQWHLNWVAPFSAAAVAVTCFITGVLVILSRKGRRS